MKNFKRKFNVAVKTSATYQKSVNVDKYVRKGGKLTDEEIRKNLVKYGVKNYDTSKKLTNEFNKRQVERLVKSAKNFSFALAASVIKGNKIETMLVNTGFTLEELAAKANTTVDTLTNEANWTFTGSGEGTFTNQDGEEYMFTFTYNDAVFERV